MTEFFKDVLTTLIGVVIGGLITIKVNTINEKKRLKMELELTLLQELKPLFIEVVKEMNLIIENVKKLYNSHTIVIPSLYPINGKSEDISEMIKNNSYILKHHSEKFTEIFNQKVKNDSQFEDLLNQIYDLSIDTDQAHMPVFFARNQNYKDEIEKIYKKYAQIKLEFIKLFSNIEENYLGEIYKN